MPNNSKTKDRLLEKLGELRGAPVLQFKRGDNRGPLLGEVFVWQETKKYAEEQLKKAWKALVAEDIIDEDDVLREAGVGEERILNESNTFSVVATVDKPRRTFNREMFIRLIVQRFRVPAEALQDMVEDAMTDGTAPLTKRVLEV